MTGTIECGQKKRQLNETIKVLLCSRVSQRRIAILYGINRKTVSRKLVTLALGARFNHLRDISQFIFKPFEAIQFDEMETFEHTKMKPLSIPMIVSEKSRKILGVGVASMPAKGHLAKAARKKYGPRVDLRRRTAVQLFEEVKPFTVANPLLTSDMNPKYPRWTKNFPCRHVTVKGRRGCVAGQGELKRGGFDPLFSFNHTAAMLRANINRLIRKTWCTTKKEDSLRDHIWLYVDFHNSVLTEKIP